MSLNKVNFKIALTFTLFTTIVSVILFSSLSFLLTNFLKAEEYKQLKFRLAAMALQYNNGGISGITNKIDPTDMLYQGKPYFIRIQREDLNLDFRPTSWKAFDFNLLNNLQHGEITKLSASGISFGLDVVSFRTYDGILLQTGLSDQYRTELVRILNKVFFILLAPLLIISLGFGLYYSSKTLKPIEDLTETIKGIIKTGKKRDSIVYSEQNELSQLSTLFNTLFDKNEKLILGMKETLDNISHDIRTPLTRIRGVTEYALTTWDSDEEKEVLSDIIEDIDVVIKILNTLLDITAAENGVLKMNIVNFNLKNLLEKTLDLFGFIAEDKGITLNFSYKLQTDMVTGDEVRIRQAISNLLDNGVKYSNINGIIYVQVYSINANFWTVEVTDSGIGISEDEIEYIFRRMYRSTKSRHEPGLGLGLSMVKAIIDSHGGTISVKSTPGKGTTFKINLPFQNGNDNLIEIFK
jgi:signal transduction histidine kinase